MIPFQAQLIGGALALAIGFGGAWQIQSWRWDASKAALDREHSRKMVQAMADYQNAAKGQEYIAQTYETEKANAKLKNDAVIAGLRRGTVRLRDPGAGVPACPTPPARPGIGDGPALAQLPEPAAGAISTEASEFLIGLVSDADSIVAQLTACQAIVRADRK